MRSFLPSPLELPSTRLHVHHLAERLADGQSVVLQFPRRGQSQESDVIAAILHLLENESGRSVGVVELSEEQRGVPPGEVLLEQLGLNLSSPLDLPTPDTIIQLEGRPEILIVRGLGHLTAEDHGRWQRFVDQWLRLIDEGNESITSAFLVPTSTGLASFEEVKHPRLVLKRYWGWNSLVETRLYARILATEARFSWAESLWAESVLSEIAVTDLTLLEWMMADPRRFTSIEDLLVMTTEYAEELFGSDLPRDLLKAVMEDSGRVVSAGVDGPPALPPSWNELWAAGALVWTPEHGVELHSAAAALAEETTTLHHRIWRGQAKILLPLVDASRLSADRLLTQRSPTGWYEFRQSIQDALRNAAGFETNGVMLTPELNDLSHYLGQHPGASKYRKLRDSIRDIRHARNKLAHYRPLSWDEFQKTVRAIGAVGF